MPPPLPATPQTSSTSWCQEPQCSCSLTRPSTVGSLPTMLPVEGDFSLAAASEFWPGETHPHLSRHQGAPGQAKHAARALGWHRDRHGTWHTAQGMQTVPGHARHRSEPLSQRWWPCGAMPRAEPLTNRKVRRTSRSRGCPGRGERRGAERGRRRRRQRRRRAGGRHQEAERAPKQREVRGGGGGRWDRPTAKQKRGNRGRQRG